MKATDLMLGDWVLCDGEPYQIAEISAGLLCIDAERELFANPEDLEPIPLTAEILEKNGFECKGGLWNLSGEDMGLMQGSFSFQAFAYYADPRYCFCEINYVHELQNALRLCGIERNIVI